jgi:hypothetical protein
VIRDAAQDDLKALIDAHDLTAAMKWGNGAYRKSGNSGSRDAIGSHEVSAKWRWKGHHWENHCDARRKR